MTKTIKANATDEKKQKEVRLNENQTIALYQNKEKELDNLSKRLEQVENILSELNKAEQTITELEKIKKDGKILLPIGGGIMLECQTEKTEKLKVMLPGNIFTEKTLPEIKEDIKSRKAELNGARTKLVEAYNNTTQTLNQISKALQQLMVMKNNAADQKIVN